MCAFVLLGGVQRYVPAEARVMVHQIWLGDRRDDPTAASYSAEDLVLVQRDIGRLAQYTVEMGGGIDLLDIALNIPPWEPMHDLTRDESRRMQVATEAPAPRPVQLRVVAGTAHLPLPQRSTACRARNQRAAGCWSIVMARGGAAPSAHDRGRGYRQHSI